jgi:hypothetical protein
MEKIDIQNFKKYYRNNDENGTLARVGHVNAVIEELNNLSPGGSNTIVTGGTNVTVAGNGTTATPYVVNAASANGSETKINAGTNVNVTGTGTTLDPYVVNAAGGGGGLEGTQYVYVAANGTDTENGLELLAAYSTAQTMNPSATNRITVIVAPGNYRLNQTNALSLNTPYIDVVSLTGNTDVILNAPGINTFNSSVKVNADNVYVKGINTLDKIFYVASGLSSTTIENCIGGNYSFGSNDPNNFSPFNITSTFINCIGKNYSFGTSYLDFAAGTYINCTAGDYSFSGNAAGKFTNCVAGEESFGAYGNTGASGTFTNCKGGNGCFGISAPASGTFINCESKAVSFGRFSQASGTFDNCKGESACFGSLGQASGKFTNCKSFSTWSFGSFGVASGTFINCESGEASFGTVQSSAGTHLGATGFFDKCTGGSNSFGGDTDGISTALTGKLYYCRMPETTGTFPTVSANGRTVLCIDGNNAQNNQ